MTKRDKSRPFAAFGRALLCARIAKGVPLRVAADFVECTFTHLCTLEGGLSAPSFLLAIRIARYYKIPLENLADLLLLGVE